MIVEAGSFLADVAGQKPAAGFERKNRIKSFQSVVDVTVQIGAVITGAQLMVLADPEALSSRG